MAESVEGLSSLTRKLKAFDADAGKLVRQLNLAAAEEVATVARALAPIGDQPSDEHPGQLLLSVKATATQSVGYVQAGGPDIPYAGPVHFGWEAHGITPHKFLVAASHRSEPAVVRQYQFGLDALLHKTGLE